MSKADDAVPLLLEVRQLLRNAGESNWINGIEAALRCLVDGDGIVDQSGFEDARSIYRTMVIGGRGFAEFNFSVGKSLEDANELNRQLDEAGQKLWKLFD